LPLSPAEIALAAEEAVSAGAAIIHLHVRGKNGRPSQSIEIFDEVTKKIKERCDCIIQYSTGGAVGSPLQKRLDPLVLDPEMATLSMGTMNFGAEIYENSQQTITALAAIMQEKNISPELEIFDLGMLEAVPQYIRNGVLPENYHLDFVLGVPGGVAATISNLVLLTDRLDADQTWTVAALGRFQLPMTAHAIAMGGHVRVGFEDNIYFRRGELAGSNGQLVARVTRLAGELERPVATVAEARDILGLV
jgi:3-keto-5-aminohexanoate cleavage enzyme